MSSKKRTPDATFSSPTLMNSTSYYAQNPQKRKECLKTALQQIQVLDDNICNNTIATLKQVINETEYVQLETSIDEKIINHDEVLIDSETMSASSNVLKECSIVLSKLNKYDFNEFANKLVQYVKPISDTEVVEPNWELLERKVLKLFRRTPSFVTLLGTDAIIEDMVLSQQKQLSQQSKQKKTINLKNIPETKKPEKMVVENETKDSLEETVEKIRKIILQYMKTHEEPLDFFKLVLDPNDFGKTVMNILHVSFLVRDGIEFTTNEKGAPILQQPSKHTSSSQKSSKNSIQNIISITMEEWKILNRIYQIKEPMIQ